LRRMILSMICGNLDMDVPPIFSTRTLAFMDFPGLK
jgi:hypothetical protein